MKVRLNWLLSLMLALPVSAEIVERKDGTRIEGTIRRVSGGWEVTESSGQKTIVPDDAVQGINQGTPANPAEAAAQRLASMRKFVDTLSDPAQAIDRYEKFIAQYKGTPAAAEAEKELDVWKSRQADKMVKVGDRWLTHEQHQELLGKIVPMIEEARALTKDNRIREAEAAVARLLAVDARNAAGLYLKGVINYKSDRIPEAKAAWDTLRDLVPDHAATLNNLAVIMSKQKQMLGALALYDKAMAAAPQTRAVLDNTAEAMHATAERDLKATSYTRASKRFTEQEGDMQKMMKEKGLFRWGSTWVDADKMAEIKAAEEKIKVKLDALKIEYDRVVDRIKEIDTLIDSNNRSLNQIDRDRTFTDGNGLMTQLPRPAIWYKLMRENDNMWAEQRALTKKLDGYKARAAEIEQERPVPAYTGVYRIIEAEGTPLLHPGGVAPTPQPKLPVPALPVPPLPIPVKPAD